MRKLSFYLVLFFVLSSIHAYSGSSESLAIYNTDRSLTELIAYYDLRERSSYIQVTNVGGSTPGNVCIHVQVFQQDKGCDELDFEDELTLNDTVVYDMDNIFRNDGSEVPINLDDNSYGYVAVSAYVCGDPDDDDPVSASLIGNFRILDDTGYEYRTNMIGEQSTKSLSSAGEPFADVVIHFNTVDGANFADIVGFTYINNRTPSGVSLANTVTNEENGVTFTVFQLDEDEERLSCDQVNFACGDNKVMNYGINEDYPASRGSNLLCKGAGLLPQQSHGHIHLENPQYTSEIDPGDFVCFVGLNNNNGTGSMDACAIECNDVGVSPSDFDCNSD